MRALLFPLVLAIIALTFAACGSSDDVPTPVPISTPALPVATPTPMATPSATPAPVSTPAPPVATPAPAETPAATPVPISTPTPQPATPTPTETPSATPAPVSTPTPQPATPTPTATPSATPAPVSTPSPPPAPEPADFAVTDNEATLSLPDSITFRLEGQGEHPIELIDLEFGSDLVFSCASSSYRSARTDFEAGRDVAVSWEWDMRRTGSIPPGSVVWWRWRLVDELGREVRTPRQETVYRDDRFDWQTHTLDNITFHWYAGGSNFGQRLADGVGDGLANLQLGRELEAPVTALVYESAADVRSAVLFAQEWTGGLAFSSRNILLIAVNPNSFERDLPGVVHELAHLLLNEVTFNCFGDLPTWLNEGLAVYAEGDVPDYRRRALNDAIANGDLISLRSLNSSFPAADSGATLSYIQSRSLVAYLIDTYGWPKMRELLGVFAEGATHEGAIQRVYGKDLDGLEADWRRWLGLP